MPSVPVDSVPLVARAPLQSPLAVHDVASVVVQLRLEAAPTTTEVGLATSDNVGAGVTAETVTVVLPEPVPPSPVQLSEYVVVCVSAGVVKVPDVAREPDHPPPAVQLCAFVVVQLRLDVPPLAICAGFADSVTVGAGIAPTLTDAVCATVPPAPVQLSAYE